MPSVPDVFIIESLRFQDEEKQHQEGQILSQVLRLTGRNPRYYYIRTRKELEEVLDMFEDSGCRYLHISCHANSKGMALTLDSLPIREIGDVMSPYLEKRRVFFSACELVTAELAKALLPGTGCYSLLGPGQAIYFDDAAVYWSSFYHVMLRREAKGMNHEGIRTAAADLARLLGVRMRYFKASRTSATGYAQVLYPHR